MALWGEPGAMIDGMYTLATDDLACNNNYKHNTLRFQCTSNMRLHEQVNGKHADRYVMKAGI